MKELDRRIVRALSGDNRQSQEELAKTVSSDLRALRDSLTRLEKAGFIELHRDGQRRIPRLTLFTGVAKLEQVTRELLEATL
jgi:predicted transcriptional regulator